MVYIFTVQDSGTKITELAFSLKETSYFVNFTLASSYNSLSEDRKRMLLEKLEEASCLDILRVSLAPLVTLYRGFPLSFIGPSSHIDRTDLIQAMKTAVKNCMDKYDTPSLAIQTNVLYLRGKMGGLFYTSNIQVPDLNSLIDAPESEEAKRAAGFVRNGVMSEFMPMGKAKDDTWAKAFWDQGYKIDACDFSWEADEHAE
jgi:hypothetical protein